MQFEIKVKREERCKCTEFHLPPLSKELLTTRNIPKDGYFFLPLPTYVFLKSVPNTIPTGPDLCRNFAQRNLFPAYTAYITVLLVRGRGQLREEMKFFFIRYSKIQSYFYLTTEEMKTFWPRLSSTVLPYCANRNIIEIRIPNSGKQFLHDESNTILFCY